MDHNPHRKLSLLNDGVPSGSEHINNVKSELLNQDKDVTSPLSSNGLSTPTVSVESVVKKAEDKCSLSDIWRISSPSEIATKLVLMTQAPRICTEMRADGVLPLLVQLLHQHSTEDGMDNEMYLDSTSNSLGGPNIETIEIFRSTKLLRRNSAKALRNIIKNTSNNEIELKILGLLEDLRSFVEILYLKCSELPVDDVDHPCSQLAEIFQLSCDQEYKKVIELLGGVYVISDVSKFLCKKKFFTNIICSYLSIHIYFRCS